MIVAVPFALARTLPLLFTDAILEFDDFHFTLLLVPVIFRVSVLPVVRVTDFFSFLFHMNSDV